MYPLAGVCGYKSNEVKGVPVTGTEHSLLFLLLTYIQDICRLKGKTEWSTYMERTTRNLLFYLTLLQQ
ncbi:hypothetical protein D3C75_835600 [compost metagenome]